MRHRGKIEAVINNAQRARELVKREGSLAGFVWRYEPDPGKLARPQTVSTCPEAITLSNELKRLGGASSARPPSMPSCRRWAWSTITPKAA